LPKAEELLNKAIEVEPARLQAYSLLGMMYVRQNRLGDAERTFTETLKRNPSSVPAGTMLAMIHDVRKDTAKAEEHYKRVLATNPDAAVAANNLAWIYVASGRHLSEAYDLARTALKALPDEPNVNDTLGWIYFQRQEYDRAKEHLQKSLDKAPNVPTTHYHLGMVYARTGEMDKARESLAKALSYRVEFDGIADARQALAAIPN
jgi:Tfp pilus assembly protein PilF